MAFSTRCFSGLFRLKLVPKLSLRYVGSDGIHRVHKHGGMGMSEGAQLTWLMTSGNVLKRLMSGHTMKVTLQFSRPMSQLSNDDADTQRMQRVFEQSSRQQTKGDGGSRLIYEVRGLGMMRFCTLFFYATALVGLYMSPDLISSALEHETVNSEMIFGFLSVGFGVVVLPVLLTMFNSRLVLRMYYSEVHKSYVAMTQTPALTLRRAEFRLSDVVPTVKNPNSILGYFKLNTLTAKGRPYFVNPYNFKLPSDFNHLMGYN
ncbi:transmembrane protein 70, mitochondrial-like [Patiria miniata]|uniref:Transmembrane protein 70 n=1 Tax=Patiria miniata TaxID=46514 RepID=A0A913ZH51_PATMI|nr:transmembrane protein 70, mitochondrial-like [Patiria miniata]